MTTINICLAGNIDPCDSYGLIACQLARHATRLGTRVNLLSIGKREMDSQDAEIAAIVRQPITPSIGAVMLGYPSNYHKHSNPLTQIGPRIALTMFESTALPSGWVEPLNEMDAVITPSWFCADVFRSCGVTVPIHVVPLGVGEIYRYAERPRERPLTFLAFLDRGARKGGITALQAFLMAFGEDMNYRLILKSRKAKVPLEFTNPNITTIHQDMTEDELYRLYLDCDVLINAHKGEGFGLLPREFAATGGIAMTTDWSGTADGLGVWGYPLPYELVKADWKGNKSLEGQELGVWAECDPARVATHLCIVAANREYYQTRAKTHAHQAMNLYSWRAFAEQVLSIWKEEAIGYATRAAAA